MSEMIEKMLQHVSVRAFKDEALSESVKKRLVQAAQSPSSSNFVQAYSLIEITDQTLRSQLAAITNSAAYVEQTGVFYVFVADLYRQAVMLEKAGQSLEPIQNMESLLVALVDATISAQSMVNAAEALDLGICYIGGIRNDLATVAKLLHLPKYTVPVFGLTIGIPETKNEPKPRLPQKNSLARNYYDPAVMTDVTDYDEEMRAYYQSRSSQPQLTDWTQKNLAFFSEVRRPQVAAFLKAQGFRLA